MASSQDETAHPPPSHVLERHASHGPLLPRPGLFRLLLLQTPHAGDERLHDGAELLLRFGLVLRHVEVRHVRRAHSCRQRRKDLAGDGSIRAAAPMHEEGGRRGRRFCLRGLLLFPEVRHAPLLVLVVSVAAERSLQDVG
eukprot:14615784-Alexandrium_andersonii.AAC.1